jgi:GT2 family glycosyltransferase
VPTAVAYHMVGATIKKRRYRPTYLNSRNKVLYFWKNPPTETIQRHLGPVVGHKTYHFLKRVCLNFYKVRTIYFLAGVLSAYPNLPYALKERKKIQASRRVSIDYLDSIMDKDFV